MRRQLESTDVLVLGSGLAAARAVAALRAVANQQSADWTVVVASRDELPGGGSSTHNLVGSMAIQAPGFMPGRDPDDAGVLALEISAGGGHVDHALANLVARRAADALRQMIVSDSLHLVTRHDDTPLITQAQFSDQARTYHLPLDQVRKVLRGVFAPPVECRPHTRPISLLTALGDDGTRRCVGALLLSKDGTVTEMRARFTLLATGGAAGLFAHSLAHADLLGDGWTLAADAGATLADTEFVRWVLAGRVGGHELTIVPVERFRRDSLHPLILDPQGNDLIEAALPDLVDRAKAFRNRAASPAFTTGNIAQRIDLAIVQANRRHEHPGRPAVRISLDGGPIFAEVAHHAWSTAGGVVVDRNGFTGVPGLYAAGEVTAGAVSAQPPAGTEAAAALVLGECTGRAIAAALHELDVADIPDDAAPVELAAFRDDPTGPPSCPSTLTALRLFASAHLPVMPHDGLRSQFLLRRDSWTVPLADALANPDAGSRWAALDNHFALATLRQMIRATLARTTTHGPVLLADSLAEDGITLPPEAIFDNTERQVVTIDDAELDDLEEPGEAGGGPAS